jgi:hypothetical protein
MDRLLGVLAVVIPLVLALALATFFLVANARRKRRWRNQGQAVTVAELVELAIQQGEATRLHWAKDDLDVYGRVRPSAQHDLPTAILPVLTDKPTTRNRGTADGGAGQCDE